MNNRFEKHPFLTVLGLGGAVLLCAEFMAWGIVEFHETFEGDPHKSQKEAILRDGGIDDPGALEDELDQLYRKTPIYHPTRWYALTPNYKGRYTVTDGRGFRNDPDTIHAGTVKIAIFGGSTIYSVCTDQAGSIPAYLERKLNTTIVQTINYGIAGYSSSAELGTFIEVTRTNPKISYAIFFDGVNDVARYIERLQDARREPFYDVVGYPFQKSAHNAARTLLGLREATVYFPYTQYLSKKLLKRFARWKDGPETREEVYQEAAVSIRDQYIENVKAIEVLARARGITPIFILQPTVFSKKQRSSWEESLYTEEKGRAFDVTKMFEMTYRLIRESDELKKINFYDMSVAFDTVNLGKDYFYDPFHVSAPANQVIAELIFNVLRPFLPDSYLSKVEVTDTNDSRLAMSLQR